MSSLCFHWSWILYMYSEITWSMISTCTMSPKQARISLREKELWEKYKYRDVGDLAKVLHLFFWFIKKRRKQLYKPHLYEYILEEIYSDTSCDWEKLTITDDQFYDVNMVLKCLVKKNYQKWWKNETFLSHIVRRSYQTI